MASSRIAGGGGSNQGPNAFFSAPQWQQIWQPNALNALPPNHGQVHALQQSNDLNLIGDIAASTFPTGWSVSRASSGTYWNSSGVLSTAANNVARIDYHPVTHAFRGLIIEPASTQLQFYATDPTQVYNGGNAGGGWNGDNSTKGSDTTTAPDGSTALLITTNSGANEHCVFAWVGTNGSGTNYSRGVFLKPGASGWCFIGHRDSDYASYMLDLSGTSDFVPTPNTQSGNVTLTNPFAQYVGNGWFYVSYTENSNASFTNQISYLFFGPLPASGTGVTWFQGAPTWTAAGTETAYAAFVQGEQSNYLTSLIPNATTSTVTRAADSISFTVGSTATEVTLLYENGVTQQYTGLTGGSTFTIPAPPAGWRLQKIYDNAIATTVVSGDGASTGSNTATAVGQWLIPADGSSTGSNTTTAVGAWLQSGTGSAAGSNTATAVGQWTQAGAGSAAGSNTATATAAPIQSMPGSATGANTATAVGAKLQAGAGSAAGSNTATAVGAWLQAGTGSATGSNTAAATGAKLQAGVGSSAGSNTTTATASWLQSGVGNATGTNITTGFSQAGSGTGTSSGSNTATAVGQWLQAGVGSSVGSNVSAAFGSWLQAGVGSSSGGNTAVAVSFTGIPVEGPDLSYNSAFSSDFPVYVVPFVVSAVGLSVGGNIATGVSSAIVVTPPVYPPPPPVFIQWRPQTEFRRVQEPVARRIFRTGTELRRTVPKIMKRRYG